MGHPSVSDTSMYHPWPDSGSDAASSPAAVGASSVFSSSPSWEKVQDEPSQGNTLMSKTRDRQWGPTCKLHLLTLDLTHLLASFWGKWSWCSLHVDPCFPLFSLMKPPQSSGPPILCCIARPRRTCRCASPWHQ